MMVAGALGLRGRRLLGGGRRWRGRLGLRSGLDLRATLGLTLLLFPLPAERLAGGAEFLLRDGLDDGHADPEPMAQEF